LSLDKHECI